MTAIHQTAPKFRLVTDGAWGWGAIIEGYATPVLGPGCFTSDQWGRIVAGNGEPVDIGIVGVIVGQVAQ